MHVQSLVGVCGYMYACIPSLPPIKCASCPAIKAPPCAKQEQCMHVLDEGVMPSCVQLGWILMFVQPCLKNEGNSALMAGSSYEGAYSNHDPHLREPL